MNRFHSIGDRRLAELALCRIAEAIDQAELGRLNEPGGVFYVGTEYVAVVVPNGIKAVLPAIQTDPDYRFVSHNAVLYALSRTGACLQLREGKTIVRSRLLYAGRRGAQRVNVILIPRARLCLEDPPFFVEAIQFFDPDFDCELSIPGFAHPRLTRGGSA